MAITWRGLRTEGRHGGDGGYVLQSLAQRMDEFIDEYLAAERKGMRVSAGTVRRRKGSIGHGVRQRRVRHPARWFTPTPSLALANHSPTRDLVGAGGLASLVCARPSEHAEHTRGGQE